MDCTNPDWDIAHEAPPKARIAKPLQQRHAVKKGLRAVYAANGKFIGLVDTRRLAILKNAFEHSKACHPQLHKELNQPTFEEAICHLITRHRPIRKDNEYNKTTGKLLLPRQTLDQLTKTFGIQHQAMSNPLTFVDSISTYSSTDSRDAIFGATSSIPETRLMGSTLVDLSEPISNTERTIRFIISDTILTDEPLLTCLLIADNMKDQAARKWLEHPAAYKVGTIPKATILVTDQEHIPHQPYGINHPNYDVDIYIITNQGGFERYYAPETTDGAQHAQTYDLSAATINHLNKESVRNPVQPKSLLKASQPMHAPWHGQPIPQYGSEWDATPQARFDKNMIIYTDGSAKDHKDRGLVTGAGAFRAQEDCAINSHIKTNGKGPTNTITRAELAAIRYALTRMRATNETIATDSSTSMYMIAGYMNDPQSYIFKKHRGLLQAIVSDISNRAKQGWRTDFIKVQSHIGIEGNEKADCLAITSADMEHPQEEVRDGMKPYAKLFWPMYECDTSSTIDNDTEWRYVNDLAGGLKEQLNKTWQQGNANDTIYTDLWKQASKNILSEESNTFWRNPQITEANITTLLKYRYGQLWNMKIAYRQRRPYYPNGHIPYNSNCPLCGSPDSATHMLLECAHKIMKQHYIHRHDKGMRLMLKTLVKNSSHNFFKIADIGCSNGNGRHESAGVATTR